MVKLSETSENCDFCSLDSWRIPAANFQQVLQDYAAYKAEEENERTVYLFFKTGSRCVLINKSQKVHTQ